MFRLSLTFQGLEFSFSGLGLALEDKDTVRAELLTELYLRVKMTTLLPMEFLTAVSAKSRIIKDRHISLESLYTLFWRNTHASFR